MSPEEKSPETTDSAISDATVVDPNPTSKATTSQKLELPKTFASKIAPGEKLELESLHNKMPSLFTRDEEKQYDTYAACLAATESLRRMRDSVLKRKKNSSAVGSDDNSWKSFLKSNIGANVSVENAVGAKDNDPAFKEEYKRACAEYVLNSSKAINALGLSVTQFNQLGREISKNRELKEKVRMTKAFATHKETYMFYCCFRFAVSHMLFLLVIPCAI
jgi:hypothetical protein